MHTVLKKHYTPVKPSADRSVLEQLLYAHCLENAHFDKADEGFTGLAECFYDWNEVRVSTVREVAEVLRRLPNPAVAASRIKRTLQSVFESLYSFDLQALQKQNIGKAVKLLRKYEGVTPFAVAYVTRSALGGHAIPLDEGLLQVMFALGVITEAEAKEGTVPGMERAIPKRRGIEFGSLAHQLGADYYASHHSPRVRSIVVEINPEAKSRLPKRATRKAVAKPEPDRASDEVAPAEKSEGEMPQPKKRGPKKPAARKKTASAGKKTSAAPAKKRTASDKKKSATQQLAKKKPR